MSSSALGARSSAALVPAGGRFDGLLAFRGSASIEGELLGRIEGAGQLRVGSGAAVSGPVEVDELLSAGSIEGEVRAHERAELAPGATLRGTLQAPKIAVASGAIIQGHCRVGTPPTDE